MADGFKFEAALKGIQCSVARAAVIDVMDSAEMALRWCKSNGVDADAAALAKFAEMILDRERAMKRELDREYMAGVTPQSSMPDDWDPFEAPPFK